MSVKHDPETYAVMMVPHESLDALNEAITEFYEGVSELRKLHRITDVEIVVQALYKAENGESVVGTTRAHFGSSAEQVPMLAWALGTAQTKRREEEAKLLGGKK